MSVERRNELVEQIVEAQPELRDFVRRLEGDMIAGSWDLLSFSFQRGFEAMWDNAQVDKSGLLVRPLLTLWRQSVELAIKAAIVEIVGELGRNPSHDLSELFDRVIEARKDMGYCDDDEYTQDVRDMIAHVQLFDPFASRFRYPAAKGGKPFEGIDIDLDELFQAHWRIVGWCEGAAIEVEESRPPR